MAVDAPAFHGTTISLEAYACVSTACSNLDCHGIIVLRKTAMEHHFTQSQYGTTLLPSDANN